MGDRLVGSFVQSRRDAGAPMVGRWPAEVGRLGRGVTNMCMAGDNWRTKLSELAMRTVCGLPIRDTADCQSALRKRHAPSSAFYSPARPGDVTPDGEHFGWAGYRYGGPNGSGANGNERSVIRKVVELKIGFTARWMGDSKGGWAKAAEDRRTPGRVARCGGG